MIENLNNYFNISTYRGTLNSYNVTPVQVDNEYRILFNLDVDLNATGPFKVRDLICNLKSDGNTTIDLSLQEFNRNSSDISFYLVIPFESIGRDYLNIYFEYWGSSSRVFTLNDNQGSKGILVSKSWWNSTPTINGGTGITVNLGEKNNAFNINYYVDDGDDDDSLTIIEKINGSQINKITNAPRNENFTINITKEMIESYDLSSVNTIQISVSDGKETTYQYYKFTRINMPPTISGDDTELGEKDENLEIKYTITDQEENECSVEIGIDDKLLRNIGVVERGVEYTFKFTHDEYIVLSNGAHKIPIKAIDSNNGITIKEYNFTKNETKIIFGLKNNILCDDKPNLFQLIIIGDISIAEKSIKVCNNAFDESPVWEDITSEVLNGSVHTFTNETKTAESWGINIKCEFKRNAGVTGPIYIDGFGGAFE